MFTDGCCDNTCTTLLGLAHHNIAHNIAITIIEMRYWLIQKNKIVRLTQSANKRHTLLLTKRHMVYASVELIYNTQLLEQRYYLRKTLGIGNIVLNLNILQRSQLAKEFKILK